MTDQGVPAAVLGAECDRLLDFGREFPHPRGGAAWLDANRTRLKEDPAALARDFRRFGRRAARLRATAERPMCVAVFGASQAGKSYLVSSLAGG